MPFWFLQKEKERKKKKEKKKKKKEKKEKEKRKKEKEKKRVESVGLGVVGGGRNLEIWRCVEMSWALCVHAIVVLPEVTLKGGRGVELTQELTNSDMLEINTSKSKNLLTC